MHLGTSLKIVYDELVHLILKKNSGFRLKSQSEKRDWLENVKQFKQLVENRWNTEIASLAIKDLQEKRYSPLKTSKKKIPLNNEYVFAMPNSTIK